MATNKTKPTEQTVPAFLESLTDEARRADAKAVIKLMQTATGEEPQMWGPSIIGFGTHHYKHESGREGDMPLVCFSPRKTSTVLYGMTSFDDAASLLAKLGKHKVEGSCLHIKKLLDINMEVLKTLIQKSIEAKQPTK